MIYQYNTTADTANSKINPNLLLEEIQQSSISKVVEYINTDGDIISIKFDQSISTEEETTLDAVVLSHSGEIQTEESAPSEVKIVESVENPPFDRKTLSTGQKLYRRKHGVTLSIAANSSGKLQLTVPYTQCKINKIELINCSNGDTCDLKVYDTPTGTISTVPNYMLNQFGFNVMLPDGFYVDESNYDADLIQNMMIEIDYTNNTSSSKSIGMNVTLHEVI